MLEKVRTETKTALGKLENADFPTALKSLVKQLTSEVDLAISEGDWDLAVKMSLYRHEFLKIHNNHDWYSTFLEIRKIRDIINLMVTHA